LRGIFWEPGSARIRGDTEQTQEKSVTSEDVTLVHLKKFVKKEKPTPMLASLEGSENFYSA
jgi:hypothetical protein